MFLPVPAVELGNISNFYYWTGKSETLPPVSWCNLSYINGSISIPYNFSVESVTFYFEINCFSQNAVITWTSLNLERNFVFICVIKLFFCLPVNLNIWDLDTLCTFLVTWYLHFSVLLVPFLFTFQSNDSLHCHLCDPGTHIGNCKYRYYLYIFILL
jgi:hypothetical protein